MNKYQEAFKYFVSSLHESEHESEDIKALLELCEKATPKKPIEKTLIRKDNYRDGTNIPRYDWWCPNCHLEHMSTNIIKHCPICGQSILWED